MDPESYAKLLNRIAERDADISTLKSKVATLEQDIILLRGKMSQRLRDLRKEFESENENLEIPDPDNPGNFKYFG